MPRGEHFRNNRLSMPFCIMYKLYHVERRPASDVAIALGCERSAVLRRMKSIGFPLRHHNDTKKGVSPKHIIINLPAKEVIEEYRNDYVSAAAVGRKFGVSVSVINRILAENGEPRKPFSLLINYKKENHPGWNSEKTDEERVKFRNDSALIEWRANVFLKDNHSCIKCGDSNGGNLNAHHIAPYWKYRELRTSVDNGATLCEPCHKSFHNKYGWKHFTADDFKEYMK